MYTPKNPHDKAMQRALIQYRNPKNYDLVKEALIQAGREDLIGFDEKCLIRPRNMGNCKGTTSQKNSKKNTNLKNTKQTPGERPKKKKTIRNIHKKKK